MYNKVSLYGKTHKNDAGEPEAFKNEGGAGHGQNLPAQEETEKDGAWFPQENGNCQRQKGPEEKTCKG